MPRTAVAVNSLARNGEAAPVAETALDPTNHHEVSVDVDGRLFLKVKNTTVGSINFTVKKGTLASGADKGADMVIAVAASAERLIGPLESATYEQTDEKFYIDVPAGATGTIVGFRLPK